MTDKGAKMTDDGPITQNEMMQLFGEEMPLEAVKLVFDAPDTATVADVRAQLRKLAHARVVEKRTETVARAICEADGKHPDSDWRCQGSVFLTVADPHPEMWRRYIKHAEAAIAAVSTDQR